MVAPTTYDVRELTSIYDTLKSEKSTLENHLQDINDFVHPSFSDVVNMSETMGRKKGQDVYTGIGMYCINKLSKAIHNALTSSASQWFNMQLANEELMDNKAIADWFGEVSRIQFDLMVRSNFPNEILKTYKALIGYGTANLNTDYIMNPRTLAFQSLKYETWPVREYVFSEADDERPSMVMRMHSMTPDKAMSKWKDHPRFKGLGKKVMDAYDNKEKRFKDKFEFLEVFYKRWVFEKDKGTKQRMHEHMPWGYMVIARQDKFKIIEGGQMEQRNAVARWEKNADDMGWGRGPSMDALPTIKTMNDVRKNGLKALGKDLDPPIVVTHRGVIGNLRTHQGAIIYKKRGAELDTLQSGSRYDAEQLYMSELKQEVKEHFLIDMIEMQPNESGTLGEFQIRYEQMMRLLGPTYGRLTYDLFDPSLTSTFNILLRNGMFPAMPQELIQLAQNKATQDMLQLDVAYTGPLARSQRSEEVGAIAQAYTDAAGIASATGTVEPFDHLDDDAAMDLIMELRGVPSQVIRAKDDIEKARKQRAEIQQKQMEAQEGMQEAELVKEQADAAGKVVQLRNGGAPQ